MIYVGVLPADCTVGVRRWWTVFRSRWWTDIRLSQKRPRPATDESSSTLSDSECLQPPDVRVTCVGPAIHRLRRPGLSSPRPSTAGCRANIAFWSCPDTSCRRLLLRLRVGRSSFVTDDWLHCRRILLYLCIFLYIFVCVSCCVPSF